METKGVSANNGAPTIANTGAWNDVVPPPAPAPPQPTVLPTLTAPTEIPVGSFSSIKAPDSQPIVVPRARWSKKRLIATISIAAAALLGAGLLFVWQRGPVGPSLQTGSFTTQTLPLTEFGQLPTSPDAVLGINGKLRVGNSLLITPSDQPTNASSGQLYYDRATNQMSYYNGTEFIALLGGTATTIQNATTINNVTSITENAAASPISGTVGRILKVTESQTAGDSIMTDTGTSITVNGNVNLVDPPTEATEISIWPNTATPDVVNQPDGNSTPNVELGVRFRADVSGIVTGIRFYKGSLNTGTHIGSLWTSGGTPLASATFTSETASGWQEVRFSSPVAISADTTYVASYHTDAAFYSITDDYFDASVDNAPLHALQDGLDGANGVFRYSLTPAFPTQTFNSTNYWVDVLFKPTTNISKYQINGAQISSADLVNNGDLAKRNGSQTFLGTNVFKSASNGVSTFNIQNAGGISLFSVDTANSRVYVGPIEGDTGGVTLALGKRTTAGDPLAGIEGEIYFNDVSKMFRCFRGGAWSDCADSDLDRSFSLTDEFMGGETTSGNVGSLGWSVHTIGGASTIGYDPATPIPVADRPGVLAVTTPAVANQGATVALAKSNASMIVGAGNTFKTAVAVGSATNQVLRLGLHTETTATTQPVSGVWWEANPGANANWQYCHGNGTVASCTSSGIPIVANTWVRLEIRVTATGTNSSAARFLINGAAINVSGATFDTANRVAPAFSCYTADATARDCFVDYFQLRGVASTAR